MTHQTHSTEAEAALDSPTYLEKQEAVLVGRVEPTVESVGGKPLYYSHTRREVVVAEYNPEAETMTPLGVVASEIDSPAAAVDSLTDSDLDHELSRVGETLQTAAGLSETGVLADKQAHVYAMREIESFERGETAELLNVAPSTVDTTLRRARRKAEGAREFVKQEEESIAKPAQ